MRLVGQGAWRRPRDNPVALSLSTAQWQPRSLPACPSLPMSTAGRRATVVPVDATLTFLHHKLPSWKIEAAHDARPQARHVLLSELLASGTRADSHHCSNVSRETCSIHHPWRGMAGHSVLRRRGRSLAPLLEREDGILSARNLTCALASSICPGLVEATVRSRQRRHHVERFCMCPWQRPACPDGHP